MRNYKKISFFIFLFVTDVYSTYQLLGSFSDGGSRLFGLFACLLFINAVYIGWMQYLKHQPESVQKTVTFRIAGARLADYSLYEILNSSWSKFRKFQSLYTISLFSLTAILFLLILLIFAYAHAGSFEKTSETIGKILSEAFAPAIYPYYLLFCTGTISIVIKALIFGEKDRVHGVLSGEYMIKFIQTLFIAFFYSIGETFITLFLVSVTSVMRVIPEITDKKTIYPKDPVS